MKFAVVGYGRMGKKVELVLRQREEVVWSIIDPDQGYPFVPDHLDGADAAICFTTPESGYEVTRSVLERGVDAVVATTKFYLLEDNTLNDPMLKELEELAFQNDCRMVYAPNFAIGMIKFQKIIELVTGYLDGLYDPAIMEWHHIKKQDVSGTAKKLAQIIIDRSFDKKSINVGETERQRRPEEITIGSARAGRIPGTHQVIFDSLVDSIELVHRVRDPNIFAHGAVDAAYLLQDYHSGLYSLNDIS
ncbi:MAG TPA: dihydrodipicolinate reductase C-terminal domain-containing protein [Patescibacteria group bacterium]|nr:dihydrodipicolinate reductase C-terminal domain-containing protein [Patescibacteria group bacterium]